MSLSPPCREEMRVWVGEAVSVLVDHLHAYGVCVMDHFLGSVRGAALMDEIHQLEAAEPFRVLVDNMYCTYTYKYR